MRSRVIEEEEKNDENKTKRENVYYIHTSVCRFDKHNDGDCRSISNNIVFSINTQVDR